MDCKACHRLLDIIHGGQMGDYIIFKTSAFITVNMGQNPINVKPLVEEDHSDGKCLLIVGNKGLTELGKGISQN